MVFVKPLAGSVRDPELVLGEETDPLVLPFPLYPIAYEGAALASVAVAESRVFPLPSSVEMLKSRALATLSFPTPKVAVTAVPPANAAVEVPSELNKVTTRPDTVQPVLVMFIPVTDKPVQFGPDITVEDHPVGKVIMNFIEEATVVAETTTVVAFVPEFPIVALEVTDGETSMAAFAGAATPATTSPAAKIKAPSALREKFFIQIV